MSSVGIHAANQKGSGPFDTSYLSPRACCARMAGACLSVSGPAETLH